MPSLIGENNVQQKLIDQMATKIYDEDGTSFMNYMDLA